MDIYNILIVDDSRSIRALLTEVISNNLSNVKVNGVKSSEEALSYIDEKKVDLILLDINMPVMNGFEFAKIIKENKKLNQIPIIFITASSQANEFVQKGFDLGAIDYIKKPFEEILLTNKIKAYVKLFRKEKELKKTYDMVSNILAHMDNLICIIDDTNIKQANKTFLDFFGFNDLEELQLKHSKISDFFILEDGCLSNEMSNESLINHLLEHSNSDIKIRLYDENSLEDRTFIVKTSCMSKETEKIKEYIISLTDITETEKLKKSYQIQSVIDPLTQIYNRQAFNDKYMKEFYNAKATKKKLTLIMADIDHFKSINDNFGHLIGDYVLKEYCKIIDKSIPNSCFFARWGGEEFIIIAKNDNLEEIQKTIEKTRVIIEEYNFLHIGHITSSFGITRMREEDSENDLLVRLDKSLYSAKKEGRNKVVLI